MRKVVLVSRHQFRLKSNNVPSPNSTRRGFPYHKANHFTLSLNTKEKFVLTDSSSTSTRIRTCEKKKKTASKGKVTECLTLPPAATRVIIHQHTHQQERNPVARALTRGSLQTRMEHHTILISTTRTSSFYV